MWSSHFFYFFFSTYLGNHDIDMMALKRLSIDIILWVYWIEIKDNVAIWESAFSLGFLWLTVKAELLLLILSISLCSASLSRLRPLGRKLDVLFKNRWKRDWWTWGNICYVKVYTASFLSNFETLKAMHSFPHHPFPLFECAQWALLITTGFFFTISPANIWTLPSRLLKSHI